MNRTERAIILLICDLHRPPDKRRYKPEQIEFIDEAVSTGNSWALNWELGDGLLAEETTTEDNRLVQKLLGMWVVITVSVERLSEQDKKKVAKALNISAEKVVEHFKFPGFYEHRYIDIAHFRIKHEPLYRRFKYLYEGAGLGCPIDAQLRMWDVYQLYAGRGDLTAEQLIGIDRASVHPDHR